MASVVCQGLQSCLEPQLIEALVLRQTLSPPPLPPPPKSEPIAPLPEKLDLEDNNGGLKTSGWSFLKALENPSLQTNNHDEVYVHPMVKRSASALSSKSLEMCTESLGSETGSDASESGDEFCSLSSEVRAIQRSKYRIFDRKVRRGDFPPPLTSISGSDCTLKVRHHREGGRLVIKAVSVSNCGTNFQAERTNGRLRLSLLRDCSVNYESGCTKMVEEDEEYATSDDETEEEVEEAAVEEEEDGGGWGWDMDGNRWKVGGKTGKGVLKRLTRCKEGGNGNKVFANWGSFWVAIS